MNVKDKLITLSFISGNLPGDQIFFLVGKFFLGGGVESMMSLIKFRKRSYGAVTTSKLSMFIKSSFAK